MTIPTDVQGRPDPSTRDESLEDIEGHILKLRWLGEEEEAQKLLQSMPPEVRQRISLSEPQDTD